MKFLNTFFQQQIVDFRARAGAGAAAAILTSWSRAKLEQLYNTDDEEEDDDDEEEEEEDDDEKY